jgi:anti-sigma-K factor RskA
MNWDDEDDRNAAAGEYVMGTLDAATRAELEQRLATDTQLQTLVYDWQDRLLPLASRARPVGPPPDLWQKIEASLAGERNRAATELPRQESPRQAPGIAANPTPSALADALRRLRQWQFAGALAMAASLALATLLAIRQPALEAPRYLTLLQAPDTQRTGWIVEATANQRIRLVPVGAPDAVPAGRTLQFWTKPQGAADPTSLGLVRAGTAVELPAARSPSIGEQQFFELTLEPEAGSPTGRPTGPILYVGRSVRL